MEAGSDDIDIEDDGCPDLVTGSGDGSGSDADGERPPRSSKKAAKGSTAKGAAAAAAGGKAGPGLTPGADQTRTACMRAGCEAGTHGSCQQTEGAGGGGILAADCRSSRHRQGGLLPFAQALGLLCCVAQLCWLAACLCFAQ